MSECGSDWPDLAELVYQAAGQIPCGKVATFGDIAAALGDRAAAQAVSGLLARAPPTVPRHRVVYATGEVGRGVPTALLESEGVPIRGAVVEDLEPRRFRDFLIEPVLRRMREEQEAVAARVIANDDFDGADRIAGLDVSYQGEEAFAALVVVDATGKVVMERTVRCRVAFPYIPTFLAYREIPPLRPLVEDRRRTIYLVDGQGLLHPRGAGIACHIGVALDVPTVGAAKSLLVGTVKDEGAERSPVLVDGEVRGWALRQGRKATYVSVGHRVSLATAVELCARILDRGIPAPLRRAHELANQARREAMA